MKSNEKVIPNVLMLAYVTYRRIISIIVRFFSVKEPTSITFHDEY